jgi:hypothetical protein
MYTAVDSVQLEPATALGPEELSQAIAKATESGAQIAQSFSDLSRRQRSAVVRAFQKQVLPRGRPGRRRSRQITRAYEDWRNGVRGVALCAKHIPRFGKLGYWERKVKMRNLLEAIRARYRREHELK